MNNSLQFGAIYPVKGAFRNIQKHLELLRNKGISARSYPLENTNSFFGEKGFIVTGEQDVAEFDAKKPDVNAKREEFENTYKEKAKNLLKAFTFDSFLEGMSSLSEQLSSLTREYKNKQANINKEFPEWNAYLEENLPYADYEYTGISPLNRAVEDGGFDPNTGKFREGYEMDFGGDYEEDGPVSF
jgi:hypothetical protein